MVEGENKMKKLLLTLMFLFLCSSVFADTNITFTWDANTETDLAGYRLYKSDQSGVYTFGAGNEEAEIIITDTSKTILVADGEWFFVLTAFDTSGNESLRSNEVTLITDSVK